MRERFKDRRDAGRQLAVHLRARASDPGLLVLGLPRGGVPVGFEVAKALGAPLDVFVVRKLGAPHQKELALGAIATGGVTVLNHDLIHRIHVTQDELDEILSRESLELERRERAFRGGRPGLQIFDRSIILVDDGLATGSTMYAAVVALSRQKPARLTVAVPVAVPSICTRLRRHADEVVCARTPEPFESVGLWYEDFAPTRDEEVRLLLERARVAPEVPAAAGPVHVS